jgi:hypothetical protein
VTPTEAIAQLLRDFPIGEREFIRKYKSLPPNEQAYYLRWARAIEVALSGRSAEKAPDLGVSDTK